MSRKLNIDDLKLMVKDCVYEEENIVCMNNQYYRKLIKRMNNLQSKIDKVNEVLNQYMPNYASCVKALDEIEYILKEDK